MKIVFTCPACESPEVHDDGDVDNPGERPGDLAVDAAVFTCNHCRTRVAFGKVAPRMVVEPFVDERGVAWLRQRFQDPVTKEDLYVVDLDPQWAAMHATNLLSITVGK